MRKKIVLFPLVVMLAASVVIAGCPAPAVDDQAVDDQVVEDPVVYEGTLYIAGMGGHFSKVSVKIDPANTASPISFTAPLGRIVIGTKATHPTHDPKIDSENSNIMFWSTYVLDAGKGWVGKSDLTTREVIKQVAVDPPADNEKPPLWCASGQTKNEFLPVWMGYPGFIDVFDKATLDLLQRVFITGGDLLTNYKFAHGINTPDMTQFLLIQNEADAPHGTMLGKVHLYLLDMAALLDGEIKIDKQGIIPGTPGTTIAFRATFTTDGKYLLLSGRDRFYLVDGKELTLLDEVMFPIVHDKQVENHDAMPTPDNKYAVLTMREWRQVGGEVLRDGFLQLYDIENKKLVGEPVSVCGSCHDLFGMKTSAILGGIDGVWK